MSDFQIRQLSESQRPQLLSFLRQDAANNIFLIGNVGAFGVRGRSTSFWGAFRQARLAGVAMLHGENACFYSPERACLDQLLPKVSAALNLSGELGLMEDVLSRLPAERLVWSTNEFFCRLEAGSYRACEVAGVRPALAADLGLLTGLYVQSESFSQLSRGQVAEQVERQLAGALYHVRLSDGEIVCAAAAVAETEDTAMIVSVFTAPAARSRGHAGAVVSSLCADLLARGKTPHLFYREDNEPAGRVYRKLGFVTIGRWKLARLSPIAKSLGMMR